jgi:hypothetical protein
MQAIFNAIRVKNAILLHDFDNFEHDNRADIYEVQHYNTTILRARVPEHAPLKYENIDIFKPVSMSSIRAISQALEYLNSDLNYKDLKTYWKQKGRELLTIGAY